jgi:hypothetical protein
MDALNAVLKATDLVAVLGREVTVRLVDISASGCRLESNSRLALGSTGSLMVTYLDEEYLDDVRIIRCLELEGSAGGYQIGAEFLWTRTPNDHSLRTMVSRLEASAVKAQSSGPSSQM